MQGLGSGVLFQVRFVLGSLSTTDQHVGLQAMSFLASDLGLGVGALLPAITTWAAGGEELSSETPELWPSVVLALTSLVYLVWVVFCFPLRCPFLPERARYPAATAPKLDFGGAGEEFFKVRVWVSGTARTFVQSAVMPALALSMHDARWTGGFRQTAAVSAICLLPMPFEALASHIRCTCSMRATRDQDGDVSKLVSGVIGAAALLAAGLQPRKSEGEDGDFQTMMLRVFELGAVTVALGIAAPRNAAHLHQQPDAERCLVLLEWLRAYVGRLLGPLFAVIFYRCVGYVPLLGMLCLATAVVTATA